MKAREFCYWLQGHLELAGAGSSVDARQVDLISRHLKMVRIHDGAAGGLAGAFCQWLEGVAQAHMGFEPPAGLSLGMRAKVQSKLSEVFLGEIDPSYPEDQLSALHLAHQGGPGPDSARDQPEFLERC